MKSYLLFIVILVITNSYAQLTHPFTQTARDTNLASGIAVSSEGTVFMNNETGGLWAFSYDGISFTNTAYIQYGDDLCGIAVGSDETIFMAKGYDGLWAYNYDGSSFTNSAILMMEVLHER